ncbi:MAG: hypothetical protein AB1Z65_18350 [Candidatus Sulfomarinibacteraceae bacterium]
MALRPVVFVLTVLLAMFTAAPGLASVADEAAGRESVTPQVTEPDPAARALARGMMQTGILLVPESTNDRVMAFDPTTGDLVDPDFIAADPTNLSTPIHAVLSADGTLVLVSDQIEDVVQSYDVGTGAYVGVFAPAGGANTAILDNIRGIAVRQSDGHLLVSVGSGTNADAIAEFDTTGNYVGNFIANGAGGLASPFDVAAFGADWLVAGINSDMIHRYDASGAAQPNFAPVNNFPEQVFVTGGGNVLVGNFSGTQEGVVEFDSTGALVGVYNPAAIGGNRGAYELGNGNILTTNGGGVHEIDRSGNLLSTKISGVSARFIEFVAQGATEADLEITKQFLGSLVVGQEADFRITVTNLGPGDAAAVVVTDTFPAELTYVSDTCGVGNANPWVWNIGTLVASATVSCDVTVLVGGAAGGQIVNVASVASSTTDPNPGNDTSTAASVVQQPNQIPTLGVAGIAVLVALMIGVAVIVLRRS